MLWTIFVVLLVLWGLWEKHHADVTRNVKGCHL